MENDLNIIKTDALTEAENKAEVPVVKTEKEIEAEINELNKQLELKTKELNRQKKQGIKLARKQLKKHHALRWRALCETVDASNWSVDDINLFCQYEPTVTNTLEAIKTKEFEKKKAETYDAIIERKEPLIDVLLIKSQEEYKNLCEEESRISSTRAYTLKEIDAKTNRLKGIEIRKEQTANILADLFETKEAIMPKKKRGRPKKTDKATEELEDSIE